MLRFLLNAAAKEKHWKQERNPLKRTMEIYFYKYLFTCHNSFKNLSSLVLHNTKILQHLPHRLRQLISWAVCVYESAISIWWKGKHWPCQIWVMRSTGLIYYSKLLSNLLSAGSKDVVFYWVEFFNDEAATLPHNTITSPFYWALWISPTLPKNMIFWIIGHGNVLRRKPLVVIFLVFFS